MSVEIILSASLVVCTIMYTIINYFVLRENQIQRKLKTRPYIVSYLQSTEDFHALRLYIKNFGYGVAKNVKVKVIQDYNMFGIENHLMSDSGMIKHGLEIFPPQAQYSCIIDSWENIRKKNFENLYIELEINYEGESFKKTEQYSNSYKLHFKQVCGQGYLNPPETYIGKIQHFLSEIHTTLVKHSP